MAALGILVLLLASACAKSAEQVAPSPAGGKYGSGVNTDLGDDKAPAATAGGTTIGGGTKSDDGPRYATPPPYNGPGPRRAEDYPFAFDGGGTGRNAPYYIRSNPYPKMVLEMVSARGSEPLPAAIDYMRARIEEVLDKPAGIEMLPMKTFVPSKTVYSEGDFATLEGKHMTRRSERTGGEVVLRFLFLNGKHEQRTVLGEAWRAGSIAIFIDQIKAISDPVTLTPLAVERAVFLHEVGHNIGLLNWGYTTPRKHYPDSNRTHSSNKESVMYYAVEVSDLIGNVFNGPPPDTFDADDKADLEDIRTGKIKPFGK